MDRGKKILYRETVTAFKIEISNVFHIPFYANQIINPFLNTRIPANHNKVDGISTNGEILINRIVSLL